MGIKHLNKILTKYAPNSITYTVNLSELSNKTIAIDLSLYLHRFYTMQGHVFTGLFHQIMLLRKFNITPVYVFDGQYSKEKTKTVEARKESKNKILKQIEELEKKPEQDKKKLFKMKNKTFCIDDNDIVFCKELFKHLGVPFIQANCEADIVLAYMCINNYAHYCLTEDFDLLTFGCNYLIKNLKGETVTMYDLNSCIDEMEYKSLEQFQDLCILCGCDYLDALPKIGPMTAYNLIKKYNTIENVLENAFYKDTSEKTKEQKYSYPEEYDFNSARQIFKSPGVLKFKIKDKYAVETINQTELVNYLKSKDFTEKKIASIVKRINL
jgi:flap endonuclease-1